MLFNEFNENVWRNALKFLREYLLDFNLSSLIPETPIDAKASFTAISKRNAIESFFIFISICIANINKNPKTKPKFIGKPQKIQGNRYKVGALLHRSFSDVVF